MEFIRFLKAQYRSLFKVFTNNKIVEDSILNFVGLQPFRIILAEILLRCRRFKLGMPLSKPAREYIKNGFCIFENLLDNEQFAEVKAEFKQAMESSAVLNHPVDQFGLRDDSVIFENNFRIWQVKCPTTFRTIFNNPKVFEVTRQVNGKNIDSFFKSGNYRIKFEKVYVEDPPANPPLRKQIKSVCNFHADTFHRITKAFFYLEDVDEDHVPFVYCPRSNKINIRRLFFDFFNSISVKYGSPRIDVKQLDKMGYKPQKMCLPKNTLILVDTFGFHARSKEGKKGYQRSLVHLDYRPEPFVPH